MTVNPNLIIDKFKEMSANGGVGTMEPLLSLFTLDGNPLSLVDREPMLPLFKTVRPKRMTVQAGRQVSKTFSIGTISLLNSALGAMQIAIIEPRFNQKKAINNQILSPLLRNCIISDKLIRSADIDTLDVKKFLSGGQLHIVNGFRSADGMRGLSGIDFCCLDESTSADTEIAVIDTESLTTIYKKICEIRKGDILTSFADDAILYSVAVRDASFHGVASCYRVRTASGREIKCTSSHTLPTSLGKVRLQEVIEYVYGVSQRTGELGRSRDTGLYCSGGEFFGTAAERHTGISAGGRLHNGAVVGGEWFSVEMEPRIQSARVQFTQTPLIIRACYPRTREERESRVRRLLVGINAEELKNVALVVRDDTPGSDKDKDHNPGFPCSDHAPDSAGVVVHGRRIEKSGLQRCANSDERVFGRRSNSLEKLAGDGVGSSCNCDYSEAQQYGERGPGSVYTEENIPGPGGSHRSLRSGMYAVQGGDSKNDVCDVRNSDCERGEPLLLSGMRAGVPCSETRGISGTYSRTSKHEKSGVESREQGEGTSTGEKVLRESVTGAEGENAAAVCSLPGTESRKDKCEEKSLESSPQRGSGIQSTESYVGQKLQREAETRSGENAQGAGQTEGILRGLYAASGSDRASERIWQGISGENEAGSGEVCETSRSRSPQQADPQGSLDRGTVVASSGVGETTQRTSQGETRGGSGIDGRGESEDQSVYVGEIQESHAGGERSYQCSTERATGAEGCGRRSYSETTRPEQIEKAGSEYPDRAILTAEAADYFYDPIVSIEYIGEEEVYDIEVVGTHNYILANGICSYNCQDLMNTNLPVFEAVADAKIDTGFRLYSGTAKTLDGTLAIKFEQSAQGHWCVKCECGKYIIFAPEEQLFTTITDKGCLCPHCSRPVPVATGGFVFKFPSRIFDHPGYHLPQTIFAFHHKPHAWKELIYKKNNIPKTQFCNEVLGVSDSDSVRLLTKQDLLGARNNLRTKEQALAARSQFDLCVLGVDWGGGGGKDSATGAAVLGKNMNVDHFETLHMLRLPTGLSPEQEAAFVNRLASEFKVDLIAHDFTGAGFMREAFFLNIYPQWRDRMFPVSYSYKPTSDLVTVSGTGSRTSYVIDKTKSLLLTIGAIKHAALTVPWFDPLDAKAPQLDFLAIIEHEQKTTSETASGNEVLRGSSVYLLDKVAGVRDDAAQAVNIGFIAMCHVLGAYPVFSYDSKFDMSDEQYRMLSGE